MKLNFKDRNKLYFTSDTHFRHKNVINIVIDHFVMKYIWKKILLRIGTP